MQNKQKYEISSTMSKMKQYIIGGDHSILEINYLSNADRLVNASTRKLIAISNKYITSAMWEGSLEILKVQKGAKLFHLRVLFIASFIMFY